MNKSLEFTEKTLEQKRELLAGLLQKRTSQAKIFPVSFAQRRMWFLNQLEPDTSAYQMSFAVRLAGAVNLLALRAAFSEVVRRHDSLRTSFTLLGDEPMQVVSASSELKFPVHDLSFRPAEERDEQLSNLIAAETLKPFDLRCGPLLRLALVRLSEEEHVVIVVMHHIMSDAWSMSIFTQEVVQLYDAFSRGEDSPLPEPAIQYADYAAWQRQWLQGEVLETELNYWREQLHEAPSPLILPPDNPLQEVRDRTGEMQWLKFDEGVTSALFDLGQQDGATLFMVTLSVYLLLLYRLTGQDDIVVGTPVAGRNQPETETLIGNFLNTLPLRVDLSGDPSFRELLRRVREVCLEAYAHQNLPFERLVEALRPNRRMNQPPFFDLLFNEGNIPEATLESPGLSFSFLDTGKPDSKFAMTIYFWGNAVQLVYQTALYSKERIASFLDQLGYLIDQVTKGPNRQISSFSLVTPVSRKLLPEPSAPLPEPPLEPLTATFLSSANRLPDHPAISLGELGWTYGQFSRAALFIADALVAPDFQPGQVVAVLGRSSFGLIASTMGVLLSGGVLLMLDRNLPASRLRTMLAEADVKQVLYAGEPEPEDGWIENIASLKVTYVDGYSGLVRTEIGAESDAPEFSRPVHLSSLLDPAYVSFTSGTTGTPKGILGCHKGLAHFLRWQRSTFGIGPGDRVAQLTNYSFDVIFRDLFLPLTSGATLCLPEQGNEMAGEPVLEWLEREKISVLHSVPSLVQSWLTSIPSGVTLKNLRYLFLAGEPLPSALVERWREAFPVSGEIVNLYGPSETTLAKSFYRVPQEILKGVQPIGWSLPETQLLILSENRQQCGIGEPGEISIRTPFRSLGYVNNAGEQRTRFVPNHFTQDDHDLLYLTGDLGRYRFDGAVEIHGRKDHQVKIHGIRIEPGEIEETMRRHERVQECVVTALTLDSGEKRLAAYVVHRPGTSATVTELRSFLERELPPYLIPSYFLTLEKLPLTANGKVDRAALPLPDQSRPLINNGYTRPTDVLELQLVQIWEDLLQVRPIGIIDNFFDLGGHSLMTVRLMNMIEKQYGQKLPLAMIFRGSTVKHLARIIRGNIDLRRRSPLVAIQPKGTRPAFYCVHPAGGNVVCYTDLAREMGTDQPFYALQTPGYEGEREPLTSFEELAACYVSAICEVQPQGPYLIGGWSLGAVLAFEMGRQFDLRGQRVALLAMMDHKAPLTAEDKPTERDDVTLLLQACGEELIFLPGELEAVELGDQLAFIVTKAKQVGMMPEDITVAQVQSYIHIYKANTQALRLYSPKPYRGAINLFRASDDLPADELDLTMGWQELALGGLEVLRVPGKHSNMVRDPQAAGLAKTLNECIKKALNDSRS